MVPFLYKYMACIYTSVPLVISFNMKEWSLQILSIVIYLFIMIWPSLYDWMFSESRENINWPLASIMLIDICCGRMFLSKFKNLFIWGHSWMPSGPKCRFTWLSDDTVDKQTTIDEYKYIDLLWNKFLYRLSFYIIIYIVDFHFIKVFVQNKIYILKTLFIWLCLTCCI